MVSLSENGGVEDNKFRKFKTCFLVFDLWEKKAGFECFGEGKKEIKFLGGWKKV